MFYRALVFWRCHFSSHYYFSSKWASCFCFVCFLLVVLKILAKILYFRRDCWRASLKYRVCSHEVVVVSESHYQNRFGSLILPQPLLLFCSVCLLVPGLWNFRGQWSLVVQWWSLRVGILWRQCLMEANLGLNLTLCRCCPAESFWFWTLLTVISTGYLLHCLSVSGLFVMSWDIDAPVSMNCFYCSECYLIWQFGSFLRTLFFFPFNFVLNLKRNLRGHNLVALYLRCR